jgi:hypothetical protein
VSRDPLGRDGKSPEGATWHAEHAHWVHLRTTNTVESPLAALRLRTDAAKRFKKVHDASAVIWKTLMVVEQRSRITCLQQINDRRVQAR